MWNLERDAFVDPRVFREIDRTESATPEWLENPVLTERLSAKHHRDESIRHAIACGDRPGPRC